MSKNVQKFVMESSEQVNITARCDYCGTEHKLHVTTRADGTAEIQLEVEDHTAVLYHPTRSIIE